MATIFNAKARDMIGDAVHRVLDSAKDARPPSEGPAQVFGGGYYDTNGMFPILMGMTKTEIPASEFDWDKLACGEVNVVSGSCAMDADGDFDAGEDKQKAAEKVLDPKDEITGEQEQSVVIAINPGCVPIISETPVIMGKQINGTWVIIWAQCPCL